MSNTQYVLSAGLEFFYALVSVILLIGCLLDHDRYRKTNRLMIAILIVHALMNVVDACVWLWGGVPELLTLMKILVFLSYAMSCAIAALFSFIVIFSIEEYTPVAKWVSRAFVCMGAVMALLWFVSLFNGMYIYWDENGVYRHGEFFWVSQAFGMAFLAANIALVYIKRREMDKKDAAVLALYCAIPLCSFPLLPRWEVTPLFTATTISLLLHYIIIHVDHDRRVAEQQTRLVQQELELTNSRTAIVLTQVRPHFIYNALTAIAQLCEKDPKMAKETTLNFSEYLRRNMDSLGQKEPIEFVKELEHTKNYLAIERIRFGDALDVEYDVEVTDFRLPALSLQSIVENAVKHGVGMKEEGGTVTISTRETPNFYEITVCDDGVGFDADKGAARDRRHIGMRLVRIRLEKLVNGGMRVDSRPNEGTTVTIYIPKEEQK